MPKPPIWLALAAACALAAPALAAPSADDPSLHGRSYTSHRQPGNHAFETPGGWHGHPRHGFEVGAHWDRTWPPALPLQGPGGGALRCGAPWRCGNASWPLGNLDIEVQAE